MTPAECYVLAKNAIADGYITEDVLNKFTTFAHANDADSVETEVAEVIESDAELVEADTTEVDNIEEEAIVEESIEAELDETEVVEAEAVVE